MKKITISVLTALTLCCAGSGVLALNDATPVVAQADTDLVYMIEGGSVRLSEPTGLGFITRIEYDHYQALVNGNYEVKTGTILLPTDYITKDIDLTKAHESLDDNKVTYLDVANNGFRNATTAQTDDYYEFRGSIVDMKPQNLTRSFSAIGYVATKATEETTEYTYEYTAYDVEKHSRSIENVAYEAFIDRSAEKDEDKKYIYQVATDGTWSRYDKTQLDILAGYMKQTVLTGTAIVEETTNKLDVTALSTAFTAQNFVSDEITAITRFGADVTLNNGVADVSKNGVYDVTLTGVYTNEKGVKIPATMNAEVDVWSAETKYKVAGTEELTSVGGYGYQSLANGIKAGNTYTLGNKTAYMTRFTPKERDVFFFRPMYSKAYYQSLLDNPYVTSYIAMDWYFDKGDKTTEFTQYFSIFDGYQKKAPALNEWVHYEMRLSDFVDMYDSIVAYYDTTLAEIATGTMFTRYDDTNGAKDISGDKASGYLASGAISGRAEYSYLSDITVVEKVNVYEETTLLVDRNQTTSVELSAHTAQGAKVVDYWNTNGYTLTYDLTARYGGADWNGENEKTFTISDKAESGIYNLQVTATKGDVSSVILTRQIDVYNSTEPVEYENFKHSDSQYAIKAYALEFTAKMGETSGLNTVGLSWIENSTIYSHDVTFTGSGSDSDTFYMLNLDKDNGAIVYDWGSADTQSKLDMLKGYATTEQEYIVTYVMPRHSKAYYEAYKDSCGTMDYKFRSVNTTIKFYYMADVTAESCSLYFTGRYWGTSDRTPTVTATIGTLINNYDAFYNCKVPMFIIKNCAATTTNTEPAKLYGIGFSSASV